MDLYYSVVIFIMGLCFGSFYNVCIYRIPEKQSVSNPPSHCYNCDTRLKPIDLIPVLSWMFLGGKCRYCGIKVSSRYAIVELMTGVLFLSVYKLYGMNIELIYYLILVSLLIIITFIDLDHYIIPDGLIIIGVVTTVIFNVLGYGVGFKESITGGLVCGIGMLCLINLIEFLVKREVMGGGDIKLFGMMGMFLGLKLGLLTIILSVYVGALYGTVVIVSSKINKKEYNSMIPYGPFISVAAIISVFYGEKLLQYYMSLF